jgi:hypothetical protein
MSRRHAEDGHETRAALPTFIGVGPPRTGTSWLDLILRGHINLPAPYKETLFFDLRYERGLPWYQSHFKNLRPGVPTGEFAPSYFASAAARERIARHIPDCKIICTLREPVARLYSNYKMWCKLALVKDSFAQVAERHQDLLSYSRYTSNIAAWRLMFGRDNTLVLIHENTLQDRQEYLDRLCAFIGAERLNLAKVAKVDEHVAGVERAPKSRRMARRARQLRGFLATHRYWRTRKLMLPVIEFCMGRGETFPPLHGELERRLRRRFEPEIEALEELLGRDLSIWRKPSMERRSEHSGFI